MTCRTVEPTEAHSLGLVQRVVPDDELDRAVDELVTELLARPTLPMYQTKRAIDAVTSQMVGTDRAFADADALVSAVADEESHRARSALPRSHGPLGIDRNRSWLSVGEVRRSSGGWRTAPCSRRRVPWAAPAPARR